MHILQYAATSALPLKTLNWMVQNQFIHNPLSAEDLIGLQLLEKVWGKREILRTQLAGFSRNRRLKLIDSADLPTKWERYAMSRLQNLQPGSQLSIERLINEIELTFDFILNASHIKRLYQIRRKVYNRRHAERRKDGSNPAKEDTENRQTI